MVSGKGTDNTNEEGQSFEESHNGLILAVPTSGQYQWLDAHMCQRVISTGAKEESLAIGTRSCPAYKERGQELLPLLL